MPNPYKVLIIEGSATPYLLVEQVLAASGYRVSVASNGNEGIKKAYSEVPHCILLDTILPDVSGFEVCRRLRTGDPYHRHPIILISSKNMPMDYNWGLKQGADYYLVNPINQELLQVVRYVLSSLFHPPNNVQQLITGYQLEPFDRNTRILPVDWTLFVPCRREEPNLLTTDNPFETASIIRDRPARRLYDVIDGHRTIRDLCQATGLSVKVVLEALRLLLNNGRIQLCTSDGTPVDISLLPKN